MNILKREFKTKPATMILILVNVIAYILIALFTLFKDVDYFRYFAIHPILIKHFNQYWRLFTANFVHFNVTHIFLLII